LRVKELAPSYWVCLGGLRKGRGEEGCAVHAHGMLWLPKLGGCGEKKEKKKSHQGMKSRAELALESDKTVEMF
jgi:hypothetical protein